MYKFKLLIVGLLITLGMSAQSLLISSELDAYATEFVMEGRARGIDTAPIIRSRVSYIFLDTTVVYPTLGMYHKELKIVRIGHYTLVDTLIVKAVLYHELAHVVKGAVVGVDGAHSCATCDDLMSSKPPSSFAPYGNKEIWARKLDELFNWLKE